MLWTVLLTAAVAVAFVVLFHRSGLPPATKTEAQNHSASPAAPPVAPTAPAKVETPAPPANGAVPTEPPPRTLAQVVTNETANYRQRMEAIHKLAAGKLSDSDRETLYDFLRRRAAFDDDQTGQVLKNELLNVLCAMQPPPSGLGELLAQIYGDPGQDMVLRDYAIQHLATYYRQMTVATGVDNQTRSDELRQAQQVMWAALANTDSSIAGTALLGLERLSQEGYPGLDQQKIAEAALSLAQDDGVGELSRITAFQVCASLNVTNALPFVLGAAEQGETMPLRISAIAALGSLGGPKQEPFLYSLTQGNDNWLKLPAQRALNQLKQRFGG